MGAALLGRPSRELLFAAAIAFTSADANQS